MLSLILLLSLELGIKFSQQGDHETSEKILKSIKSEEPSWLFYRLVNSYMLNNKEEGIKYADLILNSFQEIPTRYKDLALIMKADMETWEDGLDDISREMRKISERLKNRIAGEQTQKLQKDVLAKLEKLIKEKEDELKKKERQQEEVQSKKIQDSYTPPVDTHNGNEQGTGKVVQKKIKEIAKIWGKLPEKERVRIMSQLTRNLPAGDKQVIQNYFKEMQKRTQNKFK